MHFGTFFKLNMLSYINTETKKMNEIYETGSVMDGWTDGHLDGHHYIIISPVLNERIKKFERNQ